MITAVKKAVDDNSVIVRYYEWAGKKSAVHLYLPRRATAAWETNLMEANQNPLSIEQDGKMVAIPTNPYEIKTVKLRLALE